MLPLVEVPLLGELHVAFEDRFQLRRQRRITGTRTTCEPRLVFSIRFLLVNSCSSKVPR